jgi:hypothetical protein
MFAAADRLRIEGKKSRFFEAQGEQDAPMLRGKPAQPGK